MAAEQSSSTREKVEASLGRRNRRESVFRVFGIGATLVGVFFLATFFFTLFSQGSSAFVQTFVTIEIEFSEDILAPAGELDLSYADFDA
ncbi:MAG: DUF3333 domain-containing protein, partial [Gammaproteobacteria bacterium]|nr:DUF3333 domain-containing protein [Gammaproteobacteria bacterium]